MYVKHFKHLKESPIQIVTVGVGIQSITDKEIQDVKKVQSCTTNFMWSLIFPGSSLVARKERIPLPFQKI